jgi:RNA polymerase sigma-70 factor (ECF subfamily)
LHLLRLRPCSVKPESADFHVIHRAAIRRVYHQAGAARWNLDEAAFAAALKAAVADSVDIEPSADAASAIDSIHAEDLALACACAAGNAAAWDFFVTRYRPILYASARAITSDESRARELADSIYADLYGLEVREGRRRSLFSYFHGRSRLATWLRAVLAQRHVDYARSTRRLEPLDNIPEPAIPAAADPPDPDRARLVRALAAALAAALGALGARDRMRLGYHYRDGLKLREIGRLMGESESGVSRHLERTRRAIRASIDAALRTAHGLSREQIAMCYHYGAEDLPLDLGRALSEAS